MRSFPNIVGSGQQRRVSLQVLLIIAVCIAVYANTLHVPFYFDDVRQIVENPFIKDFSYFTNPPEPERWGIYSDFSARIVTNFTFALNYAMHGLRVEGYHIVNILIHILNAMLVYGLVSASFLTPLLSRSRAKDRSHLIALFSALVFASHPVQTQAVTYIVQRLASLATTFYLLSLVLYVKWRLEGQGLDGREAGGSGRGSEDRTGSLEETTSFHWRSVLFYSGCLLSAVLAMKSKEIAFTLPLSVTLYEFLFFQGRNAKRRLISLAPILLTLLIIPLFHLTSEKAVEGMDDIARSISGRGEVTRTEYLLTQFRVIVTYLRLLVLPINQNLDYDYPVYHTFLTPPVFFSFLFLCTIFGAGVYLLRRSKTSDPVFRLAAFGIFWFFITLSVESSIIPLTLIFEHRLYLPSVGACISFAALLFSVPGKIAARKTSIMTLACVVVLFAFAGYLRNTVWTDPVAFWRDVVQKSPLKARPHRALGQAFTERFKYEEALREYQTALEVDPGDPKTLLGLMLLYVMQGKSDEVFELYEQCKEAGILDDAKAHNYLSLAYYRTGRLAEAEKELRISMMRDPYFDEAHYYLGKIQLDQGRHAEAEQELKIALEKNPEHAEARFSMGLLNLRLDRVQEAEQELRKAVRLNPEYIEARNVLAGIYAGSERLADALQHYQAVLELQPENSEARYNAGNIYARQGRYDEAITAYQAVVAGNPGHVEAHNNLAGLYAQAGRYDEALNELNIVLRLKPDLEDARYNLQYVLELKEKRAGTGHR